jgi:hypothetical protein
VRSCAPCCDDTAALAFNLLHAIVSAKAKCYFSDVKGMKAKETQEPPEHPLELIKVSIHGPPNSHKSYEIFSYGIDIAPSSQLVFFPDVPNAVDGELQGGGRRLTIPTLFPRSTGSFLFSSSDSSGMKKFCRFAHLSLLPVWESVEFRCSGYPT